ncbi:MAG: DEAD/DEAH box helicase [Aeromicrobium sp.]|uniref:DEAD/DEAH box helicase n=1 Tax=Aeromicrobium sp. TaxID=1871063 RepID=UPI0039E55A15
MPPQELNPTLAGLIAQVDDEDVTTTFWPDTILRGRTYARQGRVVVLSAGAAAVRAVVKGSGHKTYITELHVRPDRQSVRLSGVCSCPVRMDCKHAAALLFTVQREAKQTSGADWRLRLAHLARRAEQIEAERSPLALEFAVQTGAHHYQQPDYLALRPLRRGKQGRWIKTGAAWRDLASGYSRTVDEIDPVHRAAVVALAHASGEDFRHAASAAVRLNSFGPELWVHLQNALDAGVALTAATPSQGVELVEAPVAVAIDLASGDDDAVTATTALTLDGEPLTLTDLPSGVIGSPAHGVFLAEPGRPLRLMRLDRPLDPALAPLLASAPLSVPAEDADEFLDGYVPQLARIASVGSDDGSVAVTHAEPPRLRLTVIRSSTTEASVDWSFVYRRGDRERVHPLRFEAGHGRDQAAERSLLASVRLPVDLMPQLVDRLGAPRSSTLSGPAVVRLLTEVVPWLEDRGEVEVEITGEAADLREATDDPLVSLSVEDSAADNDWFDLNVEVSIDGEKVEFAELFTALSLDQEVLLLPSGTWIHLDRPEFARLRELVEEARGLADPGSATVRVNRFQSDWWEELAGLGVVEQQSERWAASVDAMRRLRAPERIEPPASLDATLRDYQRDGLDWLAFLHEHRLGGILADDMGLGKTVQTLALFARVHETQPDARFLVVAPTSVVENWAREARRFTPTLGVRTIRETKARRKTDLADEVGDASLVVTSYALFRLEYEAYEALGWEVLVVDEAQYVKNRRGKTYTCVRRLPASTKLAITGTPLENSLMDLWSLLSITAPGLYPDPDTFSEVYRLPIESGQAPELLTTLRRRMAPLMRRRTKADVLTELPPKTVQIVDVELSAKHAKVYQTQLQRTRQRVLGLTDDLQKNRFEILKSLTLLRQLSLDPGLVDEAHDGIGSAKLDQLLDHLQEVVGEGRRALVFSQFTRFLGRARDRLDAAGIDYAYLDGRTRKRDQAIARFKDGDAPVFLISLKAGGVGLNLTEADVCFVLDPWWNPAAEAQAVDRAHRIGQQNPVLVYRYVSQGTIEEKVVELQNRKQALFASVMEDGGAFSGALSADDIHGLLG